MSWVNGSSPELMIIMSVWNEQWPQEEYEEFNREELGAQQWGRSKTQVEEEVTGENHSVSEDSQGTLTTVLSGINVDYLDLNCWPGYTCEKVT